jgi:hypothetical protein
MENFQKIVLFVAIFVLIVSLILMGIALGSASKENWPPLVSDCPDWWVADGSGNNAMCVNVKDLGICSAKSGDKHQKMNFNSDTFSGSDGTCAKYNWANKCKVSWDGITYGVENPCNN